jgi:hypothetical protein
MYIAITAVLKQYYVCVRVSGCVPVCGWVCVRVSLSVCLCAITMVISGTYYAQHILAVVRRNYVLHMFCYLRLRLHSICTPVNKRFQR